MEGSSRESRESLDILTLERLRSALILSCFAGLLVGLYLVMEPFLVPVAWAAIVVLSTWPLYRQVHRRLRRNDSAAAFVMTAALAAVVVGCIAPLLAALVGEVRNLALPALKATPELLARAVEFIRGSGWIPAPVSERLLHLMQSIGGFNSELGSIASVYPEAILQTVATAAKGALSFGFHSIVFLVTAFFFYRGGIVVASDVSQAAFRLGGERFRHLLEAIRGTIRGAVYGILATAVAQAVLAGIGYFVAGAPAPALLGVITFAASLIPFGTPFVYIPAALAVYLEHGALWGIFLLLWGVGVVSMADNILRPIFISQATHIPLLLVLFGAMGGVLAFGFIGLFIGPALMAVALALWREWLALGR